MHRLTPEERQEMFSSFERSACHLEMRDWYGVDDEQDEFRQWRTGKLKLPTEREQWWDPDWHTLIHDATQSGKRVRRARIISEPVTDYIRYEWEITYRNVESGEEVRWLPRPLATGIALPGNDLWLFDDDKVLVNHFTGDGGWIGQELVTEPAVVELCRSAFESVWKVATPHSAYQPG